MSNEARALPPQELNHSIVPPDFVAEFFAAFDRIVPRNETETLRTLAETAEQEGAESWLVPASLIRRVYERLSEQEKKDPKARSLTAKIINETNEALGEYDENLAKLKRIAEGARVELSRYMSNERRYADMPYNRRLETTELEVQHEREEFAANTGKFKEYRKEVYSLRRARKLNNGKNRKNTEMEARMETAERRTRELRAKVKALEVGNSQNKATIREIRAKIHELESQQPGRGSTESFKPTSRDRASARRSSIIIHNRGSGNLNITQSSVPLTNNTTTFQQLRQGSYC